MREVVLFYKRLIKPGGAERLLIKEYCYFKKMGYQVRIVSFEFKKQVRFFKEINHKDLIELKKIKFLPQVILLSVFLRRNRKCIFICNSGHVDFYLASVFTKIEYYLHIHQPSFMSFNEKDKYSVFMSGAFKIFVDTNYGAKKFIEIKKSLNIFSKTFINLRSILSIRAVKKAKSVFVLSNYSVREKKAMYGVEAINIAGALEESIFQYNPKKNINFNSFK